MKDMTAITCWLVTEEQDRSMWNNDGTMNGRGKPQYLSKYHFIHYNLMWTALGLNLALHNKKLASDCLNWSMICIYKL
jgi:hypothetical protein